MAASLVILLALTAACGSESETAEVAVVSRASAVEDMASQIPAEEMYGAAPESNLWTPLVELKVPGLAPGWDGGRLALISDLQLGLWEGNEAVAAAAVQRAIAENPDVIVLLGDYLAVGEDTAMLARVIAPLRGRSVVAVLGDRDVRSDSLELRVETTLRAAGIQLLKNSAISFPRNGAPLVFVGLDPGIVERTWNDQQFILASLAAPGSAPILLAHMAPLMTRAPNGRYPVALSGNTFCGQVEVPGSPRLSWLRTEALPGGDVEGIERMFVVRGGVIVVTCGVGYGFVPLRFGAAPEVPIVTLRAMQTQLPVDNALSADSLVESLRQPAEAAPTGTQD